MLKATRVSVRRAPRDAKVALRTSPNETLVAGEILDVSVSGVSLRLPGSTQAHHGGTIDVMTRADEGFRRARVVRIVERMENGDLVTEVGGRWISSHPHPTHHRPLHHSAPHLPRTQTGESHD